MCQKVNPASCRRIEARVAVTAGVLLGTALLGGSSPSWAGPSPGARLPVVFEKNIGASEKNVRFLARGNGYALFVSPTESTLILRSSNAPRSAARAKERKRANAGSLLRMHLAGADPDAVVVGTGETPGLFSYFKGSDPRKWRTGVSGYQAAECRNIYPGIDCVYYGSGGRLEYDFRLQPGARPGRIALRFPGAKDLSVDCRGSLHIQTAEGATIAWGIPTAYQVGTNGERQLVPCRYRVQKGRVQFHLGRYDRTRALVIDPILEYATYLGGSSGDELGLGVVVDAAGYAYVVGGTSSSDFPVPAGTAQAARNGDMDAFVAKIKPDGSGLVYATYLGGGGRDAGIGIAVDSSGSAYLAGQTHSADFPTTPGAYQRTAGGNWDVFVARLNATGKALIYSTFVGGINDEFGESINLDAAGNACVVGGVYVYSGVTPSFPTTPGSVQPRYGGGLSDAFAFKLNAAGSGLLYSTYLGGSGDEYAYGADMDTAGSLYVTGRTQGGAFPTTPGAFQTANHGGADAYIVKINPTGSSLVYASMLGGSADDEGRDVAVDTSGNAWVTGVTASSSFPTTPGAFQTTNHGGQDAFVVEINPTGSSTLYATYLGGSQFDQGEAIRLGPDGAPYILGMTQSPDFPTTPNAPQTTVRGAKDLFITRLPLGGGAPSFSTLLGGSGDENVYARGLAVGSQGSVYISGWTSAANFPVTPGAFQTSLHGASDPLIAKINTAASDVTAQVTVSRGPVVTEPRTRDLLQTITITNVGNQSLAGPVQAVCSGLPASVTLAGAAGTLYGSPYVVLSPGGLAPGASVTARLRFRTDSRQRFSFGIAVYAGSL